MTATWSDIFPDVDGPPVRGKPGDFEGAQRAFELMRDDAQDALEQFEKIKSDDGVEQLQGQAAVAFERFVREVEDTLGDLPRVAGDAADVFKKHAADLTDLREEVHTALVKARTNWNRKKELVSQKETADRRVERLQGQIDELPDEATDPSAGSTKTTLDSDKSEAEQNSRTLAGDISGVQDTLDGIRKQWDTFHDDEEALRKKTKDRLDDIDLGDLKDPGRFSSFCEGAFEFVMNVTGLDELFDLIEAIATGDWAKVLWKLREILDAVLLVLAIVALFTPLGPLVIAIAIGLAVAKLAIDVALYSTKWPNPETGEVISMGDIVMDVVTIATFGYMKYATAAGKFEPLFKTGQNLLKLRGADMATKIEILGAYGIKPGAFNITTLNNVPLGAVTKWNGVVPFVLIKGWGVKGAVTNGLKAPGTIVVGPNTHPLSTEVFPSIANGHSKPSSVPEKIISHVAPFTVRNTTCVPSR